MRSWKKSLDGLATITPVLKNACLNDAQYPGHWNNSSLERGREGERERGREGEGETTDR